MESLNSFWLDFGNLWDLGIGAHYSWGKEVWLAWGER